MILEQSLVAVAGSPDGILKINGHETVVTLHDVETLYRTCQTYLEFKGVLPKDAGATIKNKEPSATLYVKVTSPEGDDIIHAQEVMRNWRPNFEIVKVPPIPVCKPIMPKPCHCQHPGTLPESCYRMKTCDGCHYRRKP